MLNKIASTLQGPAPGAAIFGAVVADKAAEGYDSVFDAAETMGKVKEDYFRSIAENVQVYDVLYAEYKRLHDYFGRGENDVMKQLTGRTKKTKCWRQIWLCRNIIW